MRFKRGEIAKPFSASSIAGSKSDFHGSLPWRACATSSSRGTPGVPTERPPHRASLKDMGLPSPFTKSAGVAPAGAVSRASIAVSAFEEPS